MHTNHSNDHFQVAPSIFLLNLFQISASWQTKTFCNTIPPSCLLQTSPPSTSFYLHCRTVFNSISIVFLCFTSPDHLNLSFLVIKLTASNPNSPLSSACLFLCVKVHPHIHLNTLIPVLHIAPNAHAPLSSACSRIIYDLNTF